ncbi:MAG TPA: ABC transporter ATP-binding protein [Terriglobales bacterium]|nr:ABC transporter ATP-binding protein [Terriglobales bacterium]
MRRALAWLRTIAALTAAQRRLLYCSLALMCVARLASLVLPASSRFLVDNVLRAGQRWALLPLVGAIAGATLVQSVAEYFRTKLSARANENLVAELRLQLHRHITQLALRDYEESASGLWHSRIMNDLEGIRNLLGPGIVESAGSILTVLVTLAILMYISPRLTVVVLVCTVVFGIAVRRLMRIMRPMLRERMQIQGDIGSFLAESLRSVRVVKAYSAEPRMQAVFAGRVRRLSANMLRSADLHATVTFLTTLLSGCVIALLMYVGSRSVLASQMTVGTLVAYFVFIGFLIPPLVQLARAGAQFSDAMATMERIQEVLQIPAEPQPGSRSVVLSRCQAEIVFENVTFSYGRAEPVLRDVSFTALPGSVTALVGPSGAGKSTIINLIAGFYTPSSGRITVDGMDLNTITLDSYRRQLGIVLQDSAVFDGTIYDNVLFGCPGASREAVLSACHAAYVDAFACRLPRGYETRIGENGVNLSAGERQRIAIARAIIADPRVLILDEATSNLDLQSEFFVQRALRGLMAGRTTFIAAHRLSTVEHADQILVIDARRIVERGRHQSLWAKRGRYYEIMQAAIQGEMSAIATPPEGRSPSDPALVS